jgi:hypothetical protein
MQTAAEHYGVPPETHEVLASLRDWLGRLPDRAGAKSDDGHLWSCHALVRAAKHRFGLSGWNVVDGYFGRVGNDHSWLSKRWKQTRFIIDVYPIASVGGPLFINADDMTPWFDLYRADPVRYADRVLRFQVEADEIDALETCPQ